MPAGPVSGLDGGIARGERGRSRKTDLFGVPESNREEVVGATDLHDRWVDDIAAVSDGAVHWRRPCRPGLIGRMELIDAVRAAHTEHQDHVPAVGVLEELRRPGRGRV